MIATVEVLRYAAGGNCVARHDGRVIFIRGVIPGETVRVNISENAPSKRYAMADLIEVISPSPLRVVPACQYFGQCGGCDWQHLSIESQLQLQVEVLTDQLIRIGKLENLTILPIVTAANETGLRYRSRSRFAISDQGNFAMRKNRSNELIEINTCLIVSETIDTVDKSGWEPGTEVTVVEGSDETLILTDLTNTPEISYRNKFGSWLVPAGEFWQVHQAAPEILISQVLKVLSPKNGDRIADLYSGVGLFALPLAKEVGKSGEVVAVEFDQRAHQSAVKNLSSVQWATAINSDVAKYLKSAAGFSKAVVDPPRSGLNRSVINSLNQMVSLSQICYVSCDAGTLARDLRDFVDLGWNIESIQPMFLFPMTSHLETVVSLSKLS